LSALAVKLALSLTEAGLQILGTSTCPTAPEVQAELVNGSVPNVRSDQPAVVRLDQDSADGTLRLRVYDENGVLLGVRALPPESDCRLLAQAAATLLRSLELELEVAQAPLPLVVLNAPAKGSDETKRRVSTALELGGGAIGSFDGSAAAAGALLISSLRIGHSPIRPELALAFETPRQLAVTTSGHGSWWRIWAAPGAQWRLTDRRLFWLSLHLDLPIGAVVATGTGFPANEGGAAFDLGVSLGVRAGLRFLLPRGEAGAGLLPWLGLWGTGWPLAHVLSVAGGSSDATLPRLEACLGLGLSWSER